MKHKSLFTFGISLVALVFILSCSDDMTDPNDPKFGDNNDDPVVVESPNAEITLTVDATDAVEISPLLFGINNDWRQIPDESFPDFISTIGELNYSVLRYPGGWESEFYAWTTNSTPGWNNTPAKPGAAVSTLKDNSNQYSIVLPTTDAMNKVVGSSQWNSAIANLKARTKAALDATDMSDGLVEIGNEWWLQYAGGATRTQKLDKYVRVAMEIAAFIDTEYPNHTFKLLINGDYTKPEEFTTMKNLFTTAYDVIDGVALHTYTGYTSHTHNIEDLEQRIIDCANNFNPQKDYIYLSEWMPSRDYNDRALYMEAANILPDIFHIYARAGADAGAYWPPINSSVPGLGLTNWNYSVVYPTGQILGEMARSYKGKALKTTSNNFHLAAAQPDDNTMVLFITGGNESGKTVAVRVAGFAISSIDKVERYVPADYNETNKAEPYIIQTATAQITVDNEIVVDVNKQGKYQIYKIVIKGE